ncbi:MAG: Crp/Fnr family transcriptional regulator [Caulobacter sp.]|nr:Crp/Fnr family transcriptional regulator [Caulobacter sp.]
MSADPSASGLPAFEPDDLAALISAGASRTLKRGEVLYRQGEDAGLVLFPRAGMIRATASLANGEGVLASLVGPGGAAGLAPVLSGGQTTHGAAALTEVVGLAVEGPRLRRLAAERPSLGLVLAGLLAQEMAQAHHELACSAHHRIDQRLARLLLRLDHRAESNALVITQDDLAHMLAVQRTTVTMLAHRLKTAGMVAYNRGKLRILEHEALLRQACGCPLTQ